MRSADLFKRRSEALAAAGPALVVMPDGAPSLQAVRTTLEKLGLHPALHHNARTALATMDRARPSLVVYSARLPDMDGASFHAALQRRAGDRRIPALAIMPADRTPDQHFGRQTGIMEYICAPLRTEELSSRLQGLIPHATGMGAEAGRVDTAADEPPGAVDEQPAVAAEPAGMAQPAVAEQPAVEANGARPAPSPEAEPDDAAGIVAPPVLDAPPAGATDLRDTGVHVIGLDAWGRRAAELLAARGVDARIVEADERVEPVLEAALAGSQPGLCIIAVNLAGPLRALVGPLLQRLSELAPSTGRLVVARLPGSRSTPEDRAHGLLALNAVLQAPPAGVLLVQPEGALGTMADRGVSAPLARLIEILAATGGTSEAARNFASAGFIGWREASIKQEMCAADAAGWDNRLAGEGWQPEGFDWSEAQAVIPFVRIPRAWIDGGGQAHFEQLVQAAWEEAAPCAVAPALQAGEPPVAMVVSTGMPFPRGILALRDTVEADRVRLAEKRRAAGALIPLAEDFLPDEEPPMPAPVEAPAPVETGADATPEAAVPEPVRPAAETGDTADAVEPPALPSEVAEMPAPAVQMEDTAQTEETEEAAVTVSESSPEPPAARGRDGAVYRRALSLARRILKAGNPQAEIDLGGIRYVLYDLLEIARQNPQAILPEVFRPDEDGWFERHHVNVAVLALLVGDRVRESLSHVIDIGTAAMLHDIGMIETRDAWDADRRLPPTVFDSAIRRHPELGYRYLQQIAGMTGDIARIVLEEHERIDGTGYPEGLAGDAISPGARILAVCDTLEALTHPRPFRRNLSPAEALSRLRILAQYTLDAEIVEAMVEVLGPVRPALEPRGV